MYQFFYLPYPIEFREGSSPDELFPYLVDSKGQLVRLLTVGEVEQLNQEWNATKVSWKSRSLLLNTAVSVNKSVRISPHLISHVISPLRSPFDGIALTDRIRLANALKTRAQDVQTAFKQLRFLRSFLSQGDEERFNFFIISASWCDSCREYRTLFESYVKMFRRDTLNLHSVVIEDPKEEIFKSEVLRILFPNPAKISHSSIIPRFIALEFVDGHPVVLEEGDALKALYERYFRQHRGFIASHSKWIGRMLGIPPVSPASPRLFKAATGY
ncbi:MAG: hypothetical protein HY537_04250 [Deltaproteobacteria bacterium]|nr:hypothetical protein [Deltaproteobacteria bacterium]